MCKGEKMKIHISNIYNILLNTRVIQQHHLAEAGHASGFYEMGIYSYPVDSDTPEELNTRIDGIISSVERGDLLIFQIPTGNGVKFDEKLFDSVNLYAKVKPLLLVTSEVGDEYLTLIRRADSVTAINLGIYEGLKEKLNRTEREHLYYYCVNEKSSSLKLQACLNQVVETVLDGVSERKDEIQICMCLHDSDGTYSSRVGAVIYSTMLNTTSPVCFHILLDDSVDETNKMRLKKVADKCGARIVFHFVEKNFYKNFEGTPFVRQYSVASTFRMLAPEILNDLNKVIYLDADVMVNADINELWQMDMQDKPLAAVHDSGVTNGAMSIVVAKKLLDKNKYFNSGVLIIDLKKIRQGNSLWKQFISFYEKYVVGSNYQMPDQDALNIIFKDQVFYLDDKWNLLTKNIRKKDLKLHSAIYHFAGDKWFQYVNTAEFDRKYIEILESIPWEKSIVNDVFFRELSSEESKLKEIQDLLKRLARKQIKIIFYGINKPSMKTMCKILKPSGKDYFIGKDLIDVNGRRYGQRVKGFSALKKEKKGNFVVIVLPEADHGQALKKLDDLGLKRGEDYFVAPNITSVVQGGYIC